MPNIRITTTPMLSSVRPIGVSQGAAKRCRIIEHPSRDKAAHFALEASGNGYFTMILPNGLLEIGGLQTILSTGARIQSTDRKMLSSERKKSVCGSAPFYPKVDGQSVTMLLSPHAIRNQKDKGGGHGDHWDRQLFALWDGVHRMQRPTGRTEVVGVREQTRSPSFLVL
jgi:hypothetical protein